MRWLALAVAVEDLDLSGPCAALLKDCGPGTRAVCVREQELNGATLSAQCEAQVVQFFAQASRDPFEAFPELGPCDAHACCAADHFAQCFEPGQQAPSSRLSCLRRHEGMRVKHNHERVPHACSVALRQYNRWVARDFKWFLPKRAKACEEDQKQFCGSVPSKKVESCLKHHRNEVQPICKAALFALDAEQAKSPATMIASVQEACVQEVKDHCAGVQAKGDGLIYCLWRAKGDGHLAVSCAQEVRQAVARMQQDVRLNSQVQTSCAKEIDEMCDLELEEVQESATASGKVMQCLKERYRDRQIKKEPCRSAFKNTLRVQVLNWKADTTLHADCLYDANIFCEEEENTDAMHSCLRQSWDYLEQPCRDSEIMQKQIESQDIELSPLRKPCLLEIDRLCGHAAPDQVESCLHKAASKITGTACKTALKADSELTSKDWRLKWGISAHCMDDAQRLCEKELESEQPEGKVLSCLAAGRKQLKSSACAEQIGLVIRQQAQDWHASSKLRAECSEDVSFYCNAVEPGHGKVHECLLDHMDQVSDKCIAAEFNLQVTLSENLQLNEAVSDPCAPLLHGDGACAEDLSYQCLVKHKHDRRVPTKCRDAVTYREKLRNRDYRLNPRIKQFCNKDIQKLCANKTPVDGKVLTGKVLQCLIKERHSIDNLDCQQAVLSKVTERAEDWEIDPDTQAACSLDAVTFCGDVVPGLGRVHNCLMQNFAQLEEECRKSEFFMFALKSETVENLPTLLKACRAPYEQKCKDFPPMTQFDCLFEQRASPSVSPECRKQLSSQAQLRGRTIFFNPLLGMSCGPSLTKLGKTHSQCLTPPDTAENPFSTKGVFKGMRPGQSVFSPGQALEGDRLGCLLDHLDEIESNQCADAARMSVAYLLDDPLSNKKALREACADDIERCDNDESQTARQKYKCLVSLERKEKTCADEVEKVQKMRSYDLRLNPELESACIAEKVQFCAGLPTGHSRVVACLAAHREEDGFHKRCKEALKKAKLPVAKDVLERFKGIKPLKYKGASKGAGDTRTQKIERIQLPWYGSFKISGPLAIAAMAALFLVVFGACYICIKRRRSKGYTVYVPEEPNGAF